MKELGLNFEDKFIAGAMRSILAARVRRFLHSA